MKNILKCGITSNMLKTIALIAMVIDHIGFYFSPFLPNTIYITCRYMGRIAMPIFVYLLVQGFFHTKNFTKYICRIGIFALVTQALLTCVMFVNLKYANEYVAAKQVYMNGNILFSFIIALGVLRLIHEDIIIKKWTYTKNLSLKIVLGVVIFVGTVFIPLDYGIETLVLSILLYFIEKFRIMFMIEKNKGLSSVKHTLLNTISDKKIHVVYVILILISLGTLMVYFGLYWPILLAIIPISMYNGERGRVSMKYLYYTVFTVHHVLLYLVAMLITLT